MRTSPQKAPKRCLHEDFLQVVCFLKACFEKTCPKADRTQAPAQATTTGRKHPPKKTTTGRERGPRQAPRSPERPQKTPGSRREPKEPQKAPRPRLLDASTPSNGRQLGANTRQKPQLLDTSANHNDQDAPGCRKKPQESLAGTCQEAPGAPENPQEALGSPHENQPPESPQKVPPRRLPTRGMLPQCLH